MAIDFTSKRGEITLVSIPKQLKNQLDDAHSKYAVGEKRFMAEGPGVVWHSSPPHALPIAERATARSSSFSFDIPHGARSEILGPNPCSDTQSVSKVLLFNKRSR